MGSSHGSVLSEVRALPGQGFVLLLSQETYDTGTRPFTSSTFFELDLQTLTRREVMTSAFINGGTYGRKGVDILWRGSPMAFSQFGVCSKRHASIGIFLNAAKRRRKLCARPSKRKASQNL